MTGCRHGAKNTLLTNYLHLAERAGAVVLPLTTVRSVEPQPGAGGRWGRPERLGSGPGRAPVSRRRQFRAGQVVLAAGAFGTQKLLQAMALEGKLPELSPKLGQLTRTNSESLLAAVVPHGAPRARLQPRSGHNFVLLPAARYACGAGQVRSRLQHDGALRDHDGRGRRRCEREGPRSRAGRMGVGRTGGGSFRRAGPGPGRSDAGLRPARLVGTYRHCPGHAGP